MIKLTSRMNLEVAEELGPDKQADTDAGVVLVVVEHRLTIAVIVLQHDELIGIVVDAVAQLDNGVEIQVPALALDQCHVEHPLVVAADGLETRLGNAAVLEDVTVVLSVDDGDPELGVSHELGGDVGLGSQ